MRVFMLATSMVLGSCGGVTWNTDVASTKAARLSMAAFVVPGRTTETGLTTRWGLPTQKVREGGQTEFIYRSLSNPPGWYVPQFGNSREYVIVTFQYGLATGVRTSDGIDCRGTFPPRPPGHGFDRPTTVRLVGGCAMSASNPAAASGGPLHKLWQKLTGNWTQPPGAQAMQPPGVTPDQYVPSSGELK